jgi:hypothetical protein
MTALARFCAGRIHDARVVPMVAFTVIARE